MGYLNFYGQLIFVALISVLNFGCDQKSSQKKSTPPPQGTSDASGNSRMEPGGSTSDRYQTQSCTTYTAAECSTRGCDLLSSGCSTPVAFTGACTQYADASTCSKYGVNGCAWAINGPSNNQTQPGYPQQGTNSTTATGSCIMGNNGTVPWQNGQNQQPKFNSLAAIGAALQCVTAQDGSCGDGIMGILGKVITAGATQQMNGSNLPSGGSFSAGGGLLNSLLGGTGLTSSNQNLTE